MAAGTVQAAKHALRTRLDSAPFYKDFTSCSNPRPRESSCVRPATFTRFSTGAGKTAMMNRYCFDKILHSDATVGVGEHICARHPVARRRQQLRNAGIMRQCHDTDVQTAPSSMLCWEAPPCKYKSGTPQARSGFTQFFRKAEVVVYVFDVTNRASLTALRYWKAFVHSIVPDAEDCIVVGTKCDMTDSRVSNVALRGMACARHGLFALAADPAQQQPLAMMPLLLLAPPQQQMSLHCVSMLPNAAQRAADRGRAGGRDVRRGARYAVHERVVADGRGRRSRFSRCRRGRCGAEGGRLPCQWC